MVPQHDQSHRTLQPTNMLLKLLLGLIGIYLFLCIIMYKIQEKFIFYPTKLPSDYPFSEFSNVEEVYFPIDEQTRLHALHFQVKQSKGIVLYFHGNARALDDWGHAAIDFTRRGYEVFMPDYRGYGKSTGFLSESALYEDAQLIYKSLLNKYQESDIILYVRSLGSGIACHLATKTKPRMLLLETPYMSIVAMAQKTLPILPASMLLRFKLRNDLNIRKINTPAYLFHGTEDELIPYKQAVQLNKIYGKDALTTIEGAGHNNLSAFPAFQARLDEILL